MRGFNLFRIECPYSFENLEGCAKILRSEKRLINCKMDLDIPYYKSSDDKLVDVNNNICLFRQRILTVIKAIKKIEKNVPSFWLRKEIIYEILKSLKLDISDLEEFLNLKMKKN